MSENVNESFPRIITLLRKEKGLSQRQVAQELGIKQAGLSHYERGARECNIDFVVKIAKFYDVTTDYILGKTPDRNGVVLAVEDIPEADGSKDKFLKGSVLPVLNKKLITNTVAIIYDMLQKMDNKALTSEVSTYLIVAVYDVFRTLYSANEKNSQEMFSIMSEMSDAFSMSARSISLSTAKVLSQGTDIDGKVGVSDENKLTINTQELKEDYPTLYQSLFSLIQKAEEKMKNNND